MDNLSIFLVQTIVGVKRQPLPKLFAQMTLHLKNNAAFYRLVVPQLYKIVPKKITASIGRGLCEMLKI